MNDLLQGKLEELDRLKENLRQAEEAMMAFFGMSEGGGDISKPRTYKKAKKKRADLEEEPAEDEDPIEFDMDLDKSSCCFDRVIVRGGGEGTNHHECIKCGEACDTTRERPEPSQPKQKKKFETKLCCGSHGPRHKVGCISAARQADDEPETRKYICDDCTASFEASGSVSDVKCPECGKKNCWPQ